MYAKYQTEAVVLGSRNMNEADKIVALFTRDFGLVQAKATAVRSEGSKMRYALQNFSRAQVALIKGASGWRVAGAVSISNTPDAGGEALAALARVSQLVLRLIKGEERNEYLFAALADAHAALVQKPCDAWATIELMCVARILYSLGYLSFEAFETALFSHTAYVGEHLKEAEKLREKLLASVNRAMGETHL
ncbi:MAG: DNA repair protein RecO (recombination protein O) [Parcubacteria group bacterium Gr01-1014_8]|nr:MAG: DNA repair protein RecO (recombination protein O) [Parcubacteria group bacterium Gr01-1014_8]